MPEPTETLRDKFAMAAFTGLLANFITSPEQIARDAYKYADAMLTERAKADNQS